MFFDLVFHSLGRSERGGRASETFASPIWSRQTGFYNRLLLFFSPLSLFKIIYHLMLRKQSATEWAEVVGRDKQTTEQWPTQKKKEERKKKKKQSRAEPSQVEPHSHTFIISAAAASERGTSAKPQALQVGSIGPGPNLQSVKINNNIDKDNRKPLLDDPDVSSSTVSPCFREECFGLRWKMQSLSLLYYMSSRGKGEERRGFVHMGRCFSVMGENMLIFFRETGMGMGAEF